MGNGDKTNLTRSTHLCLSVRQPERWQLVHDLLRQLQSEGYTRPIDEQPILDKVTWREIAGIAPDLRTGDTSPLKGEGSL